MTHVVMLFLDGVGLGAEDPQVNPLVAARMPVLAELLGRIPLVAGSGSIETQHARMKPTDASLGVPGRPQSATGQTALLTGQNAPQLVGGHYGPRPNAALRQMLEGETLFSQAVAAGHAVAFANAYPAGYFAAIQRGKRLHGAIPHAVQAAGLPLRTAEDLAAGRALSVDLTNAAWRNGLGYPDMPELTPAEAGAVMARLARDHSLSFFDQWATDMVGHQGDHGAAARVLEDFDSFLGGLLHGVDLARTLVLITSDHGNLEDLSQRGHTENHVPTILIGANRHVLAKQIADLTDITPAVSRVLGGPGRSTA